MAVVLYTALYCLELTLSTGPIKSFVLDPALSDFYFVIDVCYEENNFGVRQRPGSPTEEYTSSFLRFQHFKSGTLMRPANVWDAVYVNESNSQVSLNGKSMIPTRYEELKEGDTFQVMYSGMNYPLHLKYKKCGPPLSALLAPEAESLVIKNKSEMIPQSTSQEKRQTTSSTDIRDETETFQEETQYGYNTLEDRNIPSELLLYPEKGVTVDEETSSDDLVMGEMRADNEAGWINLTFEVIKSSVLIVIATLIAVLVYKKFRRSSKMVVPTTLSV